MVTDRLVLWLGLAGGALVSLYLGFALEWDLLNYHLYNPHALWAGRLDIDLAPAQMQSFLNPALHLPYYALFRGVHSAAAVLVVGAVQGAQLYLLFRIAQELAGPDGLARGVALALAMLGLLGPIFLNQLGGAQGDTLLSLPVLAALLILLREGREAGPTRTFRSGLAAGALLGAAIALKLTMATYGLALPLAALLTTGGARRWRLLGGLVLGGLIGVAALGGPWFAWLWLNWDSPLFPYFNDLFRSEWIGEQSYRDLRFMPQSIAEWLFYPWYWLAEPLRVWEYRFRDLRLPLLFAFAVLLPWVFSRRARSASPGLAMTWLFVVISYLLWLRLFSIYRYLSVIEMLAPLLLLVTAVAVIRYRRTAAVMLGLLLVTQVLVKYDRREPEWAFQFETPTALAALPSGAMVLIDGYEPVAYAALWLPDDVPLVRLRANFMPNGEPFSRIETEAWRRAAAHAGPLYLLLPREGSDAGFLEPDMQRLGRRLDRSACQPAFAEDGLQQRVGLELCLLDPLSPAPGDGESSGR